MPNQLTPEEIERIESEATKFANENYEIDDFGRSNRPNIYDGYVAALISERLKAKALLEALEKIKTATVIPNLEDVREIAIALNSQMNKIIKIAIEATDNYEAINNYKNSK